MERNIPIETKKISSYSDLKQKGIDVYIAHELEVPKYIHFLECNIIDSFMFGKFHMLPPFFITFLPFKNKITMFIFAAMNSQFIDNRISYNLYAQFNWRDWRHK